MLNVVAESCAVFVYIQIYLAKSSLGEPRLKFPFTQIYSNELMNQPEQSSCVFACLPAVAFWLAGRFRHTLALAFPLAFGFPSACARPWHWLAS